MSLVPMTGYRVNPNPYMVENMPEVYMGMGLTAEAVADEYEVSRQAQDEFAVNSHRKAAAAYERNVFEEEIVPLEIEEVFAGPNGPERKTTLFARDEHLRADTTLEGLAKLKPVFKQGGTVTAGNSSPLSDGAAAVIVMERSKAESLGLTPILRFVGFNVGGVHPLGCTGAKLTVQLMHEMRRRNSQFGMVTMCIGGGMGAAGIFERLN